MKKVAFVVTLSLVLTLSACSREIHYPDYVQDLCGLDISGSVVVSNEDSHGGFFGEGALIVEFDCLQILDAVTQQVKSWNALPLTGNLQLIMYGGTREGVSYDGYNLAERYGIPEITNGYYFFCDRHSGTVKTDDDSSLFDRASYNFSLVIYDMDTARPYLFEFDT